MAYLEGHYKALHALGSQVEKGVEVGEGAEEEGERQRQRRSDSTYWTLSS